MINLLIAALEMFLLGLLCAITLCHSFRSFAALMALCCAVGLAVLIYPAFALSGNALIVRILNALNYGLKSLGFYVSGEMINDLQLPANISRVYKFFLYFLQVAGPLFACLLLVSLFSSLIDKFSLCFYRKIHVFSQINERSLSLAASIKENRSGEAVIFANASESSQIYKEKARALGVVSKENEQIPLRKSCHYEFYEIADERQACLAQTAALCEYLREQKKFRRDNVVVRCFVDYDALEMVRNLDRSYGNEINLRYADADNETAIEVLLANRKLLATGTRREVYIIGDSGVGLALFRNLLCLLIHPDATYSLHLFANNAQKLAEKLRSEAPEILNRPLKDYFGEFKVGGANYDIRFHAFENEEPAFESILNELRRPDLIFVCGSSDENNYKTAMQLRRIYAAQSTDIDYPAIACEIKDRDLNAMIADDDIMFFGDYLTRYDYEYLLHPVLEKAAERTYLTYLSEGDPAVFALSPEEQLDILTRYGFFAYANQHSSYNAALAMEYRTDYIISRNYDEKLDDAAFVRQWLNNDDNMRKLAASEHDRWNTYQRLQGWRKADLNQTRMIARKHNGRRVKDNDLLLHPALVSYQELAQREEDVDTILSVYDPKKKTRYVELDIDILKQLPNIVDLKKE